MYESVHVDVLRRFILSLCALCWPAYRLIAGDPPRPLLTADAAGLVVSGRQPSVNDQPLIFCG